MRAGVMVALGKGCPAALTPHLSAAAQQVQGLWEADALRIGEYAVLAEGLVAAAALAGDAGLQSQVRQFLCGAFEGWPFRQLMMRWASDGAQADDVVQGACCYLCCPACVFLPNLIDL